MTLLIRAVRYVLNQSRTLSVQTVVLHHQHLGKNETLRDLKKIFNSVFRNEEGSLTFLVEF